MVDDRNKYRRPDKVAKKYYLSPDVVALIERQAESTGYPRNVVIELMVRERFGKPMGGPPIKQPRAPRVKKEKVDLGI